MVKTDFYPFAMAGQTLHSVDIALSFITPTDNVPIAMVHNGVQFHFHHYLPKMVIMYF